VVEVETSFLQTKASII